MGMTTSAIVFSTPGGSTGCQDLIRVASFTSTSTSSTTRATTRPPSLARASTRSRTPSSSLLASSQSPSASTQSSLLPSWWTVASLLGLDTGDLSSQAPGIITTTFTTHTLTATTAPRTLGWTGFLEHLLQGSRK